MSIVLSYVLVGIMTCCSFGGFLLFKQFSSSQNILFLIAGFCLYGLANSLFLFVISDGSAARVIVISSAFQIILATAVGWYFREDLSWVHFVSTALVVTAVLLSFAHKPTPSKPDPTPTPSSTEDIRDA